MTVPHQSTPGPGRRRRRWLPLGIGLLAVAACGAAPAPTLPVGGQSVARLIAGEPTRILETATAGRRRRRPEPDLRQPWKAALGHDLRTVQPMPPGVVVERRLAVLRDAELRLAVGLPRGVNRPVIFRGLVREEERPDVVLFERWVAANPESTDRWWELRAGLGRWTGREVTLVLETTAEPGYDRLSGVPLVANPEVVAVVPPTDDRPNLVLVSVDTLRADRLSLLGYPLPTTPRIDHWATADATVFSTVVAPTPWTLPSHVSLFTGLDAARHGINHDVGGIGAGAGGDAVLELVFLTEILARAGYETAAFTGGAYLDPRFGFAQGFDRYLTWPDRSRDWNELEVGVDNALQFMAVERRRPFAVFLHTYAVHDPYRAREAFFDRFVSGPGEFPSGRVALKSPKSRAETGFEQVNGFVWRPQGGGERPLAVTDENREMISAMYDSGVAYVDHQIGRLLDGMRELGLADRTVIVLTSDHGESLGEGGRAGHIYLTDDNLLVPLIIAEPSRRGAGRRVDRQVRLVDVAPTILELLGLEPAGSVDGVSLVPLLRGEAAAIPAEAWSYAAASNRGLSLRLDGRLKLVLNDTAWPPVAGRRELYDLTRDPAESVDLAPSDPRLHELDAAATAYLEAHLAGLRLRIRTGDGRLRGRVVGAAVRPVATKVIGAGGPYLEWNEMGRAALDVPAGREITVVFEKVFGRELIVEGELERNGSVLPFRVRFDAAALDRSTAIVLVDGQWLRVDRDLAPEEIGLAVGWHGGGGVGRGPAAEDDAELAAQLHALGYVD